ncbi:MAG: hypothetical protein KGQ66_20340 [Acidobacteriota bacterium]|nr:hypothetical protein [Acidobacteriota bacterium]
MRSRIAGLVNPTVGVPRGANVNLEFINADTDEAHVLVITAAQPPFTLWASHMKRRLYSAASVLAALAIIGGAVNGISFVNYGRDLLQQRRPRTDQGWAVE